ncbi:orotate phosphoribosyltransferase [Spiroplasma chrysopicola]|uniref:Orotate phosphoribosyltransferase n=1 Tax=Spiroplasma chrysopicola DF-1 TaxID=1276227 RepID=R4UFC0_9MOLU|nr:orotate phosphoribosyltransferase [Spiroplasma chrysopicola]AGM24835.1 orotate phosphoribosyltransferase [Spiroplasma chrysopicola DF-1]
MNKILGELIKIKAISINTNQLYTWASGIKSPIYIDNRLIMGYPDLRWKISQSFQQLINKHFKADEIKVIFGTATAGIAHAAFLSHLLQLPLGYVRSAKKDHGKENQIEGVYQVGQKGLVIEDLISTGGSVIGVVKALQQAGIEVVGVLAIFSYQLNKAKDSFAELGIPLYTLTNFEQLIKDDQLLTFSEQKVLAEFHHFLNQ